MLPFYIFMGANLLSFDEILCTGEDIVVFDLDNTLHPMEHRINLKTEESVIKYLKTKNKLSDVEESINSSRTKYSTALKYVLMEEHLSYEEYRDYVFCEIDYDEILKKDESIIKLLESINKPLFIMSNGTREHVKKTLRTLGIEHLFKAVFYLGYDSNNYVGKPDVEAYQLVERLTNARKIYFFDDKERNTGVILSPKWSCHVTVYENIHNLLREVLVN